MSGMSEAQLVAGAIQDVKDRGYSSGYLFDDDTKKHCVLGSIGYARWGEQWDVDCSQFESANDEMYERLSTDSLTRSLIGRIGDAIKAKTSRKMADQSDDTFTDEYIMCYVYGWNDDLKPSNGKKDVLEVLEKVQADIGIEEM